jgi:hypothetical protein
MWLLRNHTPHAAERNWTRDEHGIHRYVIAVRATFQVGTTGGLTLEDEQPAPVLEPEYAGEPGQSSLRWDSDLLARKPGTDVTVLGQAHAPGGRPAPQVLVGLRAGQLEKQLVVYGNRVYYQGAAGLTTTKPTPFTSQPIAYEYAFGGGDTSHDDPSRHRIDERNPVGRGFPISAGLQQTPAHHLEYVSKDAAKSGPAGFGPIDRGWLPRRRLAGTYDAKWVETKMPLLPDDYDPRFAMSAPADQQTTSPMRGGERIGVTNMNPEGALIFELPVVPLRFATAIRSREHEHAAQISSVVVEPELRRVSVTWQSCLRVPAPDLDFLSTTDITIARGVA